MPFELIPAIDLLGGRCVQLSQGRYEDPMVFDDDPARQAERFAAKPLRRLHVVDLDGAREGGPRNHSAVARIVAALGAVPVELGGGIRELAHVEAALGLGVERAVLGTAALRDPALVREAAAKFPGQVGVGIDARDGRVAVEGWLETSDALAVDVARSFEDAGVAALVYTDIERDGMGTGPNLDQTMKIVEAVSIPVIASGGVGCEADVERAVALAADGLAGLIVGTAIYKGEVDLDRALRIASCC